MSTIPYHVLIKHRSEFEGKIRFVFGGDGDVVQVNEIIKHILSLALQALIEDDIYDLEEAFLMLVTPDHEIDETQLLHQLNSIVSEYKAKR